MDDTNNKDLLKELIKELEKCKIDEKHITTKCDLLYTENQELKKVSMEINLETKPVTCLQCKQLFLPSENNEVDYLSLQNL